ncbi:MAG: FeoB-associated Cys-rich membrane protein [Bacteroidaceae bacterium]|nr:FeoB-associated Cys-rich membrane protein [Bacteroidaceae bacterium]
MQEIIVYIILAIVAVVLIRYIYRQVTGKNRGCNCGSCPHCCPRTGEKECHCSNTPK